MTTMTAQTTQVYQLFIKATPEAIWDAITKPEFTIRYYHGARIETTPERHIGRGPNGEIWGDAPTLEYDPPRLLVENAGRVVSKGEILEKVWNLSPDTETRAVDNFVMRLRRYLEQDPRTPRYLHTVRGAGYRLRLET